MKIYIPEPCHENWSAMTPNEQGRFCGSCQKTVVDFTNFTTQDIQNYFAKHYGQKVCGRFNNEQLSTIQIQIPRTVFSYIPASLKSSSTNSTDCVSSFTPAIKSAIPSITTMCMPLYS